MKPRYKQGQAVVAVALPNGFPSPREEMRGLTISSSRLVECKTIKPYYRYTAVDRDGRLRIEGAETFFRKA